MARNSCKTCNGLCCTYFSHEANEWRDVQHADLKAEKHDCRGCDDGVFLRGTKPLAVKQPRKPSVFSTSGPASETEPPEPTN